MAKQYNLQKIFPGQKNDLIPQWSAPVLQKSFFRNGFSSPAFEEIEKKTLGNLESSRMSVIFMFLDSRIHHRKRYVEQVNF